MIKLLDKWRNTGFNVFCGPRILPWQTKSMENLAQYIICAAFSQERITYHWETGQVEYRSMDGKETKVLHALEWPRQLMYSRHMTSLLALTADDYLTDPDYPIKAYF